MITITSELVICSELKSSVTAAGLFSSGGISQAVLSTVGGIVTHGSNNYYGLRVFEGGSRVD